MDTCIHIRSELLARFSPASSAIFSLFLDARARWRTVVTWDLRARCRRKAMARGVISRRYSFLSAAALRARGAGALPFPERRRLARPRASTTEREEEDKEWEEGLGGEPEESEAPPTGGS